MTYRITLGAEEELQVVDQHSLGLVSHDFEQGKLDFPDQLGTSSCELHKAIVELQTPICNHPDAIVDSIKSMREVIRKRAQAQGQKVISAGLHPFSDWREQEVNRDSQKHQHYIRLVDEYADIMRSLTSCGFHVHLGIPKDVPAIAIFNSLRNYLAPVFAISLSSPFYDQRDTGVMSWRHSILDRLPRMGTPDIWKSVEDYEKHIAVLRKVGTIEAQHGMWEDMRVHHIYGTLEVRICDATPSLEHIWLITALLQCEVHTLVREYYEGRLPQPLSRACLEENKWRVRRRGLAASLVDWTHESEVTVQEFFMQWLRRLQPAAQELEYAARLEMQINRLFSQGSSAEIQRGIFKKSNSYKDVVNYLVDATEVKTTHSVTKMH